MPHASTFQEKPFESKGNLWTFHAKVSVNSISLAISVWFAGCAFWNLWVIVYTLSQHPEGSDRRNDQSVERKATQRLPGSSHLLSKAEKASDGSITHLPLPHYCAVELYTIGLWKQPVCQQHSLIQWVSWGKDNFPGCLAINRHQIAERSRQDFLQLVAKFLNKYEKGNVF